MRSASVKQVTMDCYVINLSEVVLTCDEGCLLFNNRIVDWPSGFIKSWSTSITMSIHILLSLHNVTMLEFGVGLREKFQ